MQLSRPLPSLTIKQDLSTEGGEGLSLVKGVQMPLKAIALSLKPGGTLARLEVGGAISTSGDDVVTVELADTIGNWQVRGGIRATGKRSDGLHHTADAPPPTGAEITSADGRDVVAVPTS